MYRKYAAFRDEKGLTDYQVAKLAGIERSTIYEWGRGTYTPKVDKIAKIARVLGVKITDLIEDS